MFDEIVWKRIQDTNILFGKNLEFRYIVPKINKIKNRHQLVLYFIFMRRLSYALKRNPFDGLLHNLIIDALSPSGDIAKC